MKVLSVFGNLQVGDSGGFDSLGVTLEWSHSYLMFVKGTAVFGVELLSL